jgi:hypothetical protein
VAVPWSRPGPRPSGPLCSPKAQGRSDAEAAASGRDFAAAWGEAPGPASQRGGPARPAPYAPPYRPMFPSTQRWGTWTGGDLVSRDTREPAARKGRSCQLGTSIIQTAFRKKNVTGKQRHKPHSRAKERRVRDREANVKDARATGARYGSAFCPCRSALHPPALL